MRLSVPIGKVRARAFTIPTDKPEADGTIAWNSTTLIVVEVFGGNVVGLGYTYADASITALIESKLAETIVGLDAYGSAGGVARDAACRAQSRSRRARRHRDFRGRCRVVRPESPHPGRAPGNDARHAIATRSRFTAAAVSPPIPTTSSRASSAVGCRATAARSSK